MDTDVLLFFNEHPAALPLDEALEAALRQAVPDTEIRAQKTQISFYDRRLFGCASFLRVRKKKELPEPYLVVTFGLPAPVASPRIAVATEPYPNRWTHHVVLAQPSDVDAELIGWMTQAAAFARSK